MEMKQCSETSAYKIQTPGNYPEENIQQKFTLFLHSLDVQYGKISRENKCNAIRRREFSVHPKK
jgi:hypothetical protein